MIIFKNKKLEIPVGLGPNFQEGSGEIINQNKTVDSSTFFQRVYPDPGFTGLGRVTINPYELDAKTVDSSTELQVVTSDKDGLYRVVVNPYHLEAISIDSSTKFQTLRGAYDEITVNPYTLDEKTVNSSTNTQEITSDVDGLSKVVINPYTLDEKTVDSSTNPQVITSDEDGLRQVTIRPYVLSPLEVDSSTAMQEITGQYGSVKVNPYVLDSSNAVITENGDYAFESSADGLSRVDVSVNIDTQSYYDEGYSAGESKGISEGIAQQKAKLDKATIISNGIYTREDGWNKVTVNVPGVKNQNKTVDASINSQTVTYDSGYTGLETVTVNPYTLQDKAKELEPSYRNEDTRGAVVKVEPDEGYDGLSYFQYRLPSILTSKTFDCSTATQTYNTPTENTYVKGIKEIIINPVTSSIDSNIAAGNIKKGISILGVTGTFDGGALQSKTVKSSTSKQTVTPSSGYYGLSSVIVNPYALDSKTVDPSTNNITVTSSKDGLSSVTVNPVTSSIDSNIKAGNIKKDVTILGVTGTYEGGGDPVAAPVEYISNEGDLNLVFNSGYTPNENTKIIARIAWGGEGLGSWGNYFGVQNNFALREWGGYGSGEGQITFQTISATCTVENVYTTPGDLSIVRNIEVGNNYVKADSSTASSGKYSGHISDHPMFIFGAADPGNGQLTELSSRVMRIHSFAIYEGTTLIKNLVPFQDASLNGCFYDTVSKTYIYPLQGTPTVGPVAMYQQKTVDPSLNAIEVTADEGFEALSKVTVNGVTAAVDPNIIPGNIKAGVNILGVGGSFAGAIYHRIGYVSNNSDNKKIFRNTGIIPTNNTRIEATVSFDDINSGQSGYGYFWGTTSGASFLVREMGGYGSRNVSYFDGNGIGYYSSDMSSAPRTYTHGQVEGDYSFMSYGGYIDKRSAWSHTWTTGDEIFIWAANKGNDTVDEYSSRVMRLYDFKIYEGDNLVFHGVPAADNEGACVLLDLVSNKMVEGEGTLTGGGVYVEPDEENYILNSDSSSGATAYFDLGTTDYMDISDDNNIKEYIEVIAASSVENSTSMLFGASNTNFISGQNISLYTIISSQATSCSYSGGYYGAESVGSIPSNMNKYTIVGYANKNTSYSGRKACLYINGVPANIQSNSLSTNIDYNMYIFSFNSAGNKYISAGQVKIYQFRYYNTSDGEVHVLVPAYNNGQYCFHDLISDTYIYAAGSTPAKGHIRNHYLTNNGAIDIYNG